MNSVYEIFNELLHRKKIIGQKEYKSLKLNTQTSWQTGNKQQGWHLIDNRIRMKKMIGRIIEAKHNDSAEN